MDKTRLRVSESSNRLHKDEAVQDCSTASTLSTCCGNCYEPLRLMAFR